MADRAGTGTTQRELLCVSAFVCEIDCWAVAIAHEHRHGWVCCAYQARPEEEESRHAGKATSGVADAADCELRASQQLTKLTQVLWNRWFDDADANGLIATIDLHGPPGDMRGPSANAAEAQLHAQWFRSAPVVLDVWDGTTGRIAVADQRMDASRSTGSVPAHDP
ncbi:MAG: hypothetical protein JST64_02345 [Actinobacteria bacterium]|nr:hypothetical protein [Actinomycetota bacterium]